MGSIGAHPARCLPVLRDEHPGLAQIVIEQRVRRLALDALAGEVDRRHFAAVAQGDAGLFGEIFARQLRHPLGKEPHRQRGQARRGSRSTGRSRASWSPVRQRAARVGELPEHEGQQEGVGRDVQVEIHDRMHRDARHGRQRADVPRRRVAAAALAAGTQRQVPERPPAPAQVRAEETARKPPRRPPRTRPAAPGNRCAAGPGPAGRADRGTSFHNRGRSPTPVPKIGLTSKVLHRGRPEPQPRVPAVEQHSVARLWSSVLLRNARPMPPAPTANRITTTSDCPDQHARRGLAHAQQCRAPSTRTGRPPRSGNRRDWPVSSIPAKTAERQVADQQLHPGAVPAPQGDRHPQTADDLQVAGQMVRANVEAARPARVLGRADEPEEHVPLPARELLRADEQD